MVDLALRRRTTSESELYDMFKEAIPLEGMERLVRPAPHRALLIMARLGMTKRRLGRLDRALAEDPVRCEKAEALHGMECRPGRLRVRSRLLRRPHSAPRHIDHALRGSTAPERATSDGHREYY